MIGLSPKCICAQNDCVDFEVLCTSDIIDFEPNGRGMDDFADPDNFRGCFTNRESNSAWFYFEMNASTPPGSSLGFTITPSAERIDYDFAVFGPNVSCDALGMPIRCSYALANNGIISQTGIGMGRTDESEGSNGDGFVRNLEVNPGEGYILLVDRFSTDQDGFQLEWTGEAAPFLNCIDCDLEVLPAVTEIPICQGLQDVVLEMNVTGGTAPYSYEWTGDAADLALLDATDVEDPTASITADIDQDISYTLTVRDNNDVCVSATTVTIQITAQETAVIDPVQINCITDDAVVLTASPAGGTWSGAVSSPNFDPLAVGAGEQELIYSVGMGACMSSDTLRLTVNDTLAITLDLPSRLCLEDGPVAITATPAGGVWSDSNVGDSIIASQLGLGTTDLTYSVTSPEGCESAANTSVEVTQISDIELNVVDPSCAQDVVSGVIEVLATPGAQGSTMILINDMDVSQDPFLENLEGGEYTILVEDELGCMAERMVTLPELNEPTVDIGNDITISTGQVVDIPAVVDTGSSAIVDYLWTLGGASLCSGLDCSVLNFIAATSGELSLIVTDGSGCVATASILVTVNEVSEFFAPTVFSPNDDGTNDRFTIFGPEELTNIASLSVYNRAGSLVYKAENILPNDPTGGWDGRWKGQVADPGVYVFVAEIQFGALAPRVVSGDVTLVR